MAGLFGSKKDDRPVDQGLAALLGKSEAEAIEWWKKRLALIAAIPSEVARVGAVTPQLRELSRISDAEERKRLTGLAVPSRWGGAELDTLTIALVMEELGAGDGSVALTLAAHNSLCIGHVLVAATDDQKERWLPPLARGEHLGAWALTEPGSGSDAIAVQSRARRDGDGYAVIGTKQFITNGAIAGFCVVLAGAGERKLSAFGIARGTRGLRPGRSEEKMGLHASDTSQLVLEDCWVPLADRIGAEGEAFTDVKRVLDGGRIGIAALAIGLGRAALDAAIAYGKERRQFGRAIVEF